MINGYDVILEAIFTERTTNLSEKENVYTFRVRNESNKLQIKNAIEMAFNVNVIDVRTVNAHSKKKYDRYRGIFGKTTGYKKALVKLAKGEKIEFV